MRSNNSFKYLANKIISQARHSDLEYTETQVKGKLTQVATKVSGPLAAKVNKIYEGIESRRVLMKQYKAQTDELTDEAKKLAADFFDEDDKVLTRIINTNKYTLKFSKVLTETVTKTTKDVDKLEQLVEEIGTLIAEQEDELSKKIKDMIANCQYIKETIETKKSPEKVLTEAVSSLLEKLLNKLNAFKNKVVEFIESFDARQNKIDELFNKVDDEKQKAYAMERAKLHPMPKKKKA